MADDGTAWAPIFCNVKIFLFETEYLQRTEITLSVHERQMSWFLFNRSIHFPLAKRRFAYWHELILQIQIYLTVFSSFPSSWFSLWEKCRPVAEVWNAHYSRCLPAEQPPSIYNLSESIDSHKIKTTSLPKQDNFSENRTDDSLRSAL